MQHTRIAKLVKERMHVEYMTVGVIIHERIGAAGADGAKRKQRALLMDTLHSAGKKRSDQKVR